MQIAKAGVDLFKMGNPYVNGSSGRTGRSFFIRAAAAAGNVTP